MASPASISLARLVLLLPLALLFTSIQASQGAMVGRAGGSARRSSGYVPVRTVVYRSVAIPAAASASAEASGGGGGGGRYEPFELCMWCRCCSAAANASGCVDTTCCYAIDCNIPGKPFGVCAFTPRTCGCAATNCTQ